MTTTAETVFNITGMAAELPLTVPVGLKYFTAVLAGKGIDRLSLHQVKMPVPPFVSATIRTETFLLSSRDLHNGLTTAFAYRFSISRKRQIVPAAE
jgi:hypothetical protein